MYATGAIPALIWLRPKIHYPEGKPNKKGALLVLANHRTIIDPILVQTAFPFRRMNSIATKDLFSSPAKEKFFTLMNCIKIDKDNFSTSSFHDAVAHIALNGSFCGAKIRCFFGSRATLGVNKWLRKRLNALPVHLPSAIFRETGVLDRATIPTGTHQGYGH